MAFLDTHRFDRLSEKEVLHRIGDLLAVAIGRFEQRQQTKARELRTLATQTLPNEAPELDPAWLVDNPLERQIVVHLRKVGTATPRELGAVLGLTRRTISRKLARLRAAGLCEVEGRTRMACYRLRTEFGDN